MTPWDFECNFRAVAIFGEDDLCLLCPNQRCDLPTCRERDRRALASFSKSSLPVYLLCPPLDSFERQMRLFL